MNKNKTPSQGDESRAGSGKAEITFQAKKLQGAESKGGRAKSGVKLEAEIRPDEAIGKLSATTSKSGTATDEKLAFPSSSSVRQPEVAGFKSLMKSNHADEEGSDTDSKGSDLSGFDGDDTSWISWFCGLKGNEFFCEVDDEFIQDDFNLDGLSTQVPYYDYALDLVMDVESATDDTWTEEQNEMVESAAEMLYGLIHVRYILTSRGLNSMMQKCKDVGFGRCPRIHCSGQPCLPVGQSDIPRTSTVKIYCPKCEDIYYPKSKYQGNVDGAYFGTTFPHLFLMSYPHLKPSRPTQSYVPRVFGFKLHRS